jgi:hypothetical protein
MLSAGLIAVTTKVEDVDGGPPEGVLSACPVAATTEVGDVDGGPPRSVGGRSGNSHHQS